MASYKPVSGVTEDQVIKAPDRVRDIRSFTQRAKDWLDTPQNMVMFLLGLASATCLFPVVAAWVFIPAFFLFLWAVKRKEVTPIKIPIQAGKAGMLDINERNPGNGSAMPGQGIFHIGNDIRSAKELWLTNSDCRQHFLVLGTTGAGKALANSALVHTPLGWRRMGELRVGGRVSTPDGRSAEIQGVYPQGQLDICRVTFEDGRVLDVCPEHLWEIHRSSTHDVPGTSRAARRQDVSLLRTLEVAALLGDTDEILSVPLPQPVEKPAAQQPVAPYVLGSELGKSAFAGPASTERVQDELMLSVWGDQQAGRAETEHRHDEVLDDSHDPALLRLFGIDLGKAAVADRFVPASYKEASVAQRWALLQGLMDASGRWDHASRSIIWVAHSQRLATDVQEIARSLGAVATLSQTASQSMWQLSIRHPEPARFFSLPHKLASVDRSRPRNQELRLAIRHVEMNVRREDATCIYVDHPDHLFVAENYVVTHNTETLIAFAANALSWGSGFLFCDGKGDVSLFAKIYAMARRFGREDDLLVLNFMNGNKGGGGKGSELQSNTLNPFATGTSDGLVQMIVSLMDDVGGDGAMWKGRATAMLTGIMYALCWLRDQGLLELNVGEIRDHMNLKKIIELSDEALIPDLPPKIRHSIRSYLTSLPGYAEDKKEKQAQTTLDQHGYLEMQFTRIFGNLADVYGHIFATPYGEVDMFDVVLNRRLLVIMLPALEKSGDEIANLGKVVVASLKAMMGATLGNKLEGSWDQVVENRVTTSPSPFMVILDEVGYYTVEGMALMAAQARSLGFSMVYASQDLNAMKRLNEKEAQSIIANTNTKIGMRTEDPDTAQLFIDLADEALRVQIDGPEREMGEFGTKLSDTGRTNIEKAKRITLLDLKSQGEGEMHVLFQEKVVRARSFYPAPQYSVDRKTLHLRPNHFVWVPKPSREDMETAKRAPELMARLADPEFPAILGAEIKAQMARLDELADNGDEVALTARTMNKMIEARRKPIEASCAAVADLMRTLRGSVSSFNDSVRDAYRMPTAVPSGGAGGFSTSDFDFGPSSMPTGLQQPNFVQPGVPFSDVPPPTAPHRRPFQPPPRRAPKLDPAVPHGASVDDGELVNMAERIGSNDAIMRTLAALDFDSEDREATPSAVESRIEEALGGFSDTVPEAPAERKRVVSAVEAFDRAAAALGASPASSHEEDGDGGESGGEEGGELVSRFLEQLLSDEAE